MLNKYDFSSIFKDELNYFVKYKRSLGLKYKNEISILKYIDNSFLTLKLKSKKITKKTFSELVKRNGLQGKHYARRYGVIKDFCKFLVSSGYKNIYYENKKFKIVNNYKPVIFNECEIKMLFKTMDSYTKQSNFKYYQLHYSYSVLFRLLYSCGLRKTEAIKLTVDNIDLNRNIIIILDSKNRSSRSTVLSETMKKVLKNYIEKFDIQGLLFKNSNNNIIINQNLELYYKKILKISNLNTNSHIHDLRHVFCNSAFNQMLEKGYDENVVIVYLYKYMGHKTITETEYYLHFTDYNKNKLLEANDTFSKKLYERVDLDD